MSEHERGEDITVSGQRTIAAEDALAEAAAGDPEITVGDGRCCELGRHFWAVEATAEGDTCECGQWYRFDDRIESTDIAAVELTQLRAERDAARQERDEHERHRAINCARGLKAERAVERLTTDLAERTRDLEDTRAKWSVDALRVTALILVLREVSHELWNTPRMQPLLDRIETALVSSPAEEPTT